VLSFVVLFWSCVCVCVTCFPLTIILVHLAELLELLVLVERQSLVLKVERAGD